MRRSAKLFAAGVLALLASSLSTGAQALEKCYRLNPFVDYLKLEFDPVVNGHRNVYGNWVAPGSYTLPMSGAIEFDLGSTTVKRLGIVGTGGVVDGNLMCGLDGIPGRGWRFVCAGGPNAAFQNSGSPLTQIPCAGLAPSSARVVGRVALAK